MQSLNQLQIVIKLETLYGFQTYTVFEDLVAFGASFFNTKMVEHRNATRN